MNNTGKYTEKKYLILDSLKNNYYNLNFISSLSNQFAVLKLSNQVIF